MLKKFFVVLVLITSTYGVTLMAQDTTPSPYIPSIKKGDQSISIMAGGFIPLFVLDATGSPIATPNMSPGAAFGMQYRYMTSKNIGFGASIAGSFVTTIGGGTLFLAPIGAFAAWVSGSDPLELEISTELGMNIIRLYGNGIISPYAKLGALLSRYISSSWSLGVKANWWFVPEVHLGAYSALNSYANFMEISVAAVYHF